jgi:hypothetical protein
VIASGITTVPLKGTPETYDRFGQTAQVIKKKAIEYDAHN